MTLLLATLLIAQEAVPLQPATVPPPDGRAYVTSAPNDPSWLVLVTQDGRWVIQPDCGPEVIPPASDVQVVVLDDVVLLQPMELDLDGTFYADSSQACWILQAFYAGDTPCAQLEGVCTVAAEGRT